MTTPQFLYSPTRELLGQIIGTNTATNQFNLTDLATAAANGREVYGWSHKGQIQDLISQKENSERIYYLLKETGRINSDFSEFMKEVQQKGMVKTLKSLKCYRTTGRGENKTVWCDPYLWVLIAMEINPMLYGKTVVWLTDKLVINRIEAGDLYKELTKAIASFAGVDYSALAKALNFVVFNRHASGIRNTASEAELKELRELESNLTFSITSGLISSFPELINQIRKLWTKKYGAVLTK